MMLSKTSIKERRGPTDCVLVMSLSVAAGVCAITMSELEYVRVVSRRVRLVVKAQRQLRVDGETGYGSNARAGLSPPCLRREALVRCDLRGAPAGKLLRDVPQERARRTSQSGHPFLRDWL